MNSSYSNELAHFILMSLVNLELYPFIMTLTTLLFAAE
jgi:hypothetical protein